MPGSFQRFTIRSWFRRSRLAPKRGGPRLGSTRRARDGRGGLVHWNVHTFGVALVLQVPPPAGQSFGLPLQGTVHRYWLSVPRAAQYPSSRPATPHLALSPLFGWSSSGAPGFGVPQRLLRKSACAWQVVLVPNVHTVTLGPSALATGVIVVAK